MSVRRGRLRHVAVVAAALVAVSFAVVACAPPPPPPPEPVAPTDSVRNLPVATQVRWFVDGTRGIPALGWSPRLIPTSVWYPSDSSHAPYPLVVFAPGFGVGPDAYADLLTRVASAGYVVAAPLYPMLSGWPAGPTDSGDDWNETFADTRFVTTSMLDLSASGDPTFGGLIDPQRIGVAGHSDGALISFSDGFVAWRNDPRVRAVISYAARLGEPGTIYQPNGRAFLHFLSDQDPYNDFGASIAWDHQNLGMPSTIVGLWNADHAGPYSNPADPHFDLVANATIEFFDQELKGQSTLWLFLEILGRPDLAAYT